MTTRPKNSMFAPIRPAPARGALVQVLTDLSTEDSTMVAVQAARGARNRMDVDQKSGDPRIALMRSVHGLDCARAALDRCTGPANPPVMN